MMRSGFTKGVSSWYNIAREWRGNIENIKLYINIITVFRADIMHVQLPQVRN